MSKAFHTTEGIYAILDTESGKFISFGTKCGWERKPNAKQAFQCHAVSYDDNWKKPKFEDQSRYAVVELTGYYFKNKENSSVNKS